MTDCCRTLLCVAATQLLAACTTAPPTPDAGAPVAYRCADGREFSVRYHADGAQIEINRMRFELRPQPAATGVRYACDVLELSAKGNDLRDEIRLDIQGETAYTACRALPPAH